jgi:Flp pilus assembly pilin Flp
MLRALRSWARDEAGFTAVEYGLISCIIVATIVAMFGSLGQAIDEVATDVRLHLVEVTPTP